ncbi:hypothetical protein DFR41_104355 [Pseudacidovorax intermedius]|uniref:Uncharacterized protein n=1 Tax=Pseudacidovorax intermedius TaxID=433924 RepID=A0A370FGW8_9BURK|nr:hypothetical protein DFR41_104355 [Pseudacidovorax intermedius]
MAIRILHIHSAPHRARAAGVQTAVVAKAKKVQLI